DIHAHAGQPFGDRRGCAVGTRDVVTQRVQHLGDTAHAGAADTDEVHAAEALHDVAVRREAMRGHAATFRQRCAITAAASGFASVRAAFAIARRLPASRNRRSSTPAKREGSKSRSCTSSAAPAATKPSAFLVWWSSTACGNGS